MSAWTDANDKANGSLFRRFGEPVLYSRPGNSSLDPIAEFSSLCVPATSLEYTSNRATEAAIYIRLADIPEGPQKGDLVVWRSTSYVVQEIPVKADGLAGLGIRMTQP